MSKSLTIEDIERARDYLDNAPLPSPPYMLAAGLDDETVIYLLGAGVKLLLHPDQTKRVGELLEVAR